MEALSEILAKSVALFILVLGGLGFLLSFLLMVYPELVRNLNRRLGFWIHLDEKLAFLDKVLLTDRFLYRQHVACGTIMTGCSIFLLIFLFFNLDINKCCKIFVLKDNLMPIFVILLSAAILVGKLSSIIGIGLGALLIFAPGKMKTIENKMASEITTGPAICKLNECYDSIDTIFLRYPIVLGLVGICAGMSLIFTGMALLTSNFIY